MDRTYRRGQTVPVSSFKDRYLRWLNRTLNPLTLRAARSGRGPFSLVEHVGRKSGRTFEAPLILAPVPDGFVAELTYGDRVNWYRNLLAGGGRVFHRGKWYRVVGVEAYGVEEGLRALGAPASWVLRLLRRREFRLLRVEADL
ncbi:nitroreductase family deazaflavin-dependent oxidoreductase [Microbacterium paludicola]|uniref:Nitroreductase family deazaflavin-dependent oxidoreductase n=1 Tax=Microbacterium paludicola TaxID=300019 RepID=A0A4Y9FMZ4_9MICO|nr:nitroreductase family deazaflavin-dependent oxidoreductase [Microbacterium paludicola]TFU30587.1 nitroreductase family deazaflavin-dependent oxidoreductase [Microbacterium paludicola]